MPTYCIEPGCPTRSLFNVEGAPSGIYCSKHKKPGMINVRDKSCAQLGCYKIASYKFVGVRHLFCDDHKRSGMVKIITCLVCCKRPTINDDGVTPGVYCAEHDVCLTLTMLAAQKTVASETTNGEPTRKRPYSALED